MQEFDRREKRQGQIMGTVCLVFAIIFILLAITLIVLGYFVPVVSENGVERDGLGTMLDEVPGGLSLILPQWAGHIWFIVDCLVLLGMVVIIDRLFVMSKNYFTGIKNVDF